MDALTRHRMLQLAGVTVAMRVPPRAEVRDEPVDEEVEEEFDDEESDELEDDELEDPDEDESEEDDPAAARHRMLQLLGVEVRARSNPAPGRQVITREGAKRYGLPIGATIPPGLRALTAVQQAAVEALPDADRPKYLAARRDGATHAAAMNAARGEVAPARKAPAKRAPAFDAAEVAGRIASQKTEADVIKLLSADSTLTAAKLRKIAEHLGIDVPDTARAKSALQLLIAENEANERDLPGGFDAPAAPAKKAAPRKAALAKKATAAKRAPASGVDVSGDEAFAMEVLTAADHLYGDAMLRVIARRQGFDGLPTVVSRAEMDRLIASGRTPIYRGVAGIETDDGFVTAAQVQEQMRSGPATFGVGRRTAIPEADDGSGYYFSADPDDASILYSDGTPGSVVRGVLKPDARHVGFAEIEAERQRFMAGYYELDAPFDATRSAYGTDVGRFAASKGYDVIDMPGEGGAEIWHLVVNRTALILEEGTKTAGRRAATSAPADTVEAIRNAMTREEAEQILGAATQRELDALATVSGLTLWPPTARTLAARRQSAVHTLVGAKINRERTIYRDLTPEQILQVTGRRELTGMLDDPGQLRRLGLTREQVQVRLAEGDAALALGDSPKHMIAFDSGATAPPLRPLPATPAKATKRTPAKATPRKAPAPPADTSADDSPVHAIREIAASDMSYAGKRARLDRTLPDSTTDLRRIAEDGGWTRVIRGSGGAAGLKARLIDAIIDNPDGTDPRIEPRPRTPSAPRAPSGPPINRSEHQDGERLAALAIRPGDEVQVDGRWVKVGDAFIWGGSVRVRDESGAEVLSLPPSWGIPVRKAPEAPDEPDATAPDLTSAPDLNAMTVANLRALARERGITIPSRARKADIIRLLGGTPDPATPAQRQRTLQLAGVGAAPAPARRLNPGMLGVGGRADGDALLAGGEAVAASSAEDVRQTLQPYRIGQLRAIAIALRINIPRQQNDGQRWTVEALRDFITAAIVRDRGRFTWRSIDPGVEERADAPGNDLKRYWTKGEGLAKWVTKPHPWTALRNHLRKYVGPGRAERIASQWFKEVFGIWPGERKGENPVGPG